jgi:hypothetical protein
MIHESSYWKDDLIRYSKNLLKRANQKKWFERSFVVVEKEIFISFYTVRKLIDSNKLTNKLCNKSFPVNSHVNLGKTVNQINRHDIDKLFDLKNHKKLSLNLRTICNLFIHSYIFIFDLEKGVLDGIFVSSDFTKDKNLYWISLKTITEIFKEVGENYPSKIVYKAKKNKNDYEVFNY